MQTSSLNRIQDRGLSALCRALAPAQVRVSFAGHLALPFRIEFASNQGLRSFQGATVDAAAAVALRCLHEGPSGMVARAIAPEGEGPYVDALREWIEQVTPASEPPRPLLRLVR